MKKLISLLLVFLLVGCGSSGLKEYQVEDMVEKTVSKYDGHEAKYIKATWNESDDEIYGVTASYIFDNKKFNVEMVIEYDGKGWRPLEYKNAETGTDLP